MRSLTPFKSPLVVLFCCLSIGLQLMFGWKSVHTAADTSFMNCTSASAYDSSKRKQQRPIMNKSAEKTIAQTIVHKAYTESYATLQECDHINIEDKHGEARIMSTRSCIMQSFLSNATKTDGNTNIPWWFRTLTRDILNPSNKIFTNFHMLTSPNVDMCSMGKVATTQWRKVFCDLDWDGNPCQEKRGKHGKVLSVESGGMVPRTSGNEKPRFVFLRDPLERFLSAFLDKCVSEHRFDQHHCEPSEVFQNFDSHQAPPLTVGLQRNKRELFEAYVDVMPLKWNMHFIPQSFFCNGLYRDIGTYDLQGVMGGTKDDKCFYNDVYSVGVRYGDDMMASLEKVFNISAKKGLNNHGTETSAVRRVKDFYTKKTVRRVLEYLSIDYVMLNLTIPEWANEILEEGDELNARVTNM